MLLGMSSCYQWMVSDNSSKLTFIWTLAESRRLVAY